MGRYEQVLRHIRYRNWRPASLQARRFRIKCSELNGRYTSNEFNLEVSESCGCKGSPSSPTLPFLHSRGLLPLAPTCHSWSAAPRPALPRSASSMRSESQTRSTSTTLSYSLPSSSPSSTQSLGLASSVVQVGHLAGGTSGHWVIIDSRASLNRHLGCTSHRCPDLKVGPDSGEAVDPGSEALTQPH